MPCLVNCIKLILKRVVVEVAFKSDFGWIDLVSHTSSEALLQDITEFKHTRRWIKYSTETKQYWKFYMSSIYQPQVKNYSTFNAC